MNLKDCGPKKGQTKGLEENKAEHGVPDTFVRKKEICDVVIRGMTRE